MLNHTISELVDKNIDDLMSTKPSIKEWLKNHERKHILIQRLTDAIKGVELKNPYLIDKGVITTLAKEFTILFCKTALETREIELNNKRSLEDNLVISGITEEDNKKLIID